MRINGKCAESYISPAIRRRLIFDSLYKIEAGKDAQQHHQRVAAGFLRIAEMKCIYGQQHGCNKPGAGIEQATAQEIDGRNRGEGKNDRKAANEGLAVAEPEPGVQQDVVQRHIGFTPPKNAQEVISVEPGNSDADAFIKPKSFCAEGVEA